MPTSVNEANEIMEIIERHVPIEQIEPLIRELHESVGVRTENSSLKISLEMLFGLAKAYEGRRSAPAAIRIFPDPVVDPQTATKAMFVGIVAGHYLTVIVNGLGLLLLPFWFMLPSWMFGTFTAFGVWTAMFVITLSPAMSCPATAIENRLRRQLEMPEIDGFVSHYFFRGRKLGLFRGLRDTAS